MASEQKHILTMMYYSLSDTGILGHEEIQVLLSGVEHKTFQL